MKQSNQIFVVDDNISVCRALKILLNAYGYVVKTFTSSLDFFAAVPGSAPGCLILDIHMPGMDGWDTLKSIVASGSIRPVIIISADKNGGSAARALKSGAIGYLQKPFSDQQLLGLIKLTFIYKKGE